MNLPDQLLEQAHHLARLDRKKPQQANLRRAISSAYYGLFHLLVDDASRAMVKGGSKQAAKLRTLFARSFEHAEMKDVSKLFASGGLPPLLAPVVGKVDPNLQLVAQAFVDLQQARHEADYDVGKRFARAETQALLARASEALATWRAMPPSHAGQCFLVALATWKKLRGRPS